MIETLKTTITIEARKETPAAIYQLNYSVVDNTLATVNCSVNKKATETVDTPEGNQTLDRQIYAGNLYLNNGNVTCSIPQDNDVTTFVTEFMDIVEDIRETLQSGLLE